MSRTWDVWMLNMVVYKVIVAGLWRAKHTPFFYLSQQPYRGQGRLIGEVPRSHTDTPHSVGLLWTSNRSVQGTSPWQHNTHKRQKSMAPAEFEPIDSASRRPQTQASGRASTSFDECCSYSECCDRHLLRTDICLVLYFEGTWKGFINRSDLEKGMRNFGMKVNCIIRWSLEEGV